MDLTFEIFNGLCFGIEFVSKDDDIPESAIAVHFACIRMMIWLGDEE